MGTRGRRRRRIDEKSPVTRTTLYFDPEIYKAIRIAAIREGLPVTRLVERLVRDYLKTIPEEER